MSRGKLFVLIAIVIGCPPSNAENWPGWRGPRGDGSSTDKNVPLKWDVQSGENIRWQIDVRGEGHSSPIVWGDRLFLTTCLTDSTERVLLCYDRVTGNLIWQRTVFQGPLESLHSLNSRASGTPATDGHSIYVAFMRTDGKMVLAPNVGTPRNITAGEMVVAAYDWNGERKWLVSPGEFVSAHGFSSCPVLFDDLVIINGDHDGNSYIVALDKLTGEERWRRKRKYGIRSYVTPIIRDVAGHTQMVFSGSQRIVSLNPNNGELYWSIEGPTEQFVASMVFDGKQFFMNCGYPDYFVVAVRPDGNGDVTETGVVWESTEARSYVPSPVVVDGYLLVADDRGTGNCFDTETGTRYWQARLGKGFSSSLVHANGNVYFSAQNGAITTIRPGKRLDIVAKNDIGEEISSSPAISDGCFYIRGEDSLFCIGSTE